MKTADRYALTANGLVAAIGPEAEITRICRWNRVLSSPYEWNMYWVAEDKVVNTDAEYSTPPSSPLVDKLFSLLHQTQLLPQYHYEVWWPIKWIKEMTSPGLCLIKVGNYSCDLLRLEPVRPYNAQAIEDAYRHYDYWLKDLRSGDTKNAIAVTVSVPEAVDGDAALIPVESAIALLEVHMGAFPPRPAIVRDGFNLYFHTEEDAAYYREVKAEAEKKGLLKKFEDAIQNRCINNYSDKVWYRCTLSRDRAPMSFGWCPEYKKTENGPWLPMFPGGGGLIFHEYCQDWSTHT